MSTAQPSTLHRQALDTVRSWRPPTAEQEALRQRYVDLLLARPDATSRSCFPDHLTAGVIVLNASRRDVLLNLHRKANRWFAFGGHLEDGDESLLAAALREGREESGIEDLRIYPDPVHLSCHPVQFCDPRGTVHHFDVRYLATVPDGTEPLISTESTDVRWFSIHDLPTDEPDMIELITLARQIPGRRSPG